MSIFQIGRWPAGYGTATRPLPKYVLPAALVTTGLASCALAAVLALNTWRKAKPRESLCPGSDPIEDTRVAAAMAERKLAIAETLGAAIRLETVSWDKPSDDEGGGIKHRSGCANPLHGHDEEDVVDARPRPAASAAATDASRAAFLQFHGLLAERYPRMHAALERHVVGGLSLLFVWRGSDPSLPATGLYAHMDVVPASDPELWSFAPFGGEVSGAASDPELLCGRSFPVGNWWLQG